MREGKTKVLEWKMGRLAAATAVVFASKQSNEAVASLGR